MSYYYEARAIGELLQEGGLQGSLEDINNIISAGMTSTEILMGIKYYLEKIKKKKINDTTKEKILSLIGEIEKVLK